MFENSKTIDDGLFADFINALNNFIASLDDYVKNSS
jgi:hypothetical protein